MEKPTITIKPERNSLGRFFGGFTPWNKGKKLSASHRKKLSISHIGNKPTQESINKRVSKMIGDKHFNWKGNDVGYYALHFWVKRNFGRPVKCEDESCTYPRFNARGVLMEKPKRYEWAFIGKKYDRERLNWKMLCPSCHRKFDYGRK